MNAVLYYLTWNVLSVNIKSLDTEICAPFSRVQSILLKTRLKEWNKKETCILCSQPNLSHYLFSVRVEVLHSVLMWVASQSEIPMRHWKTDSPPFPRLTTEPWPPVSRQTLRLRISIHWRSRWNSMPALVKAKIFTQCFGLPGCWKSRSGVTDKHFNTFFVIWDGWIATITGITLLSLSEWISARTFTMDVIYLDLYCVILPETDYRENSLHLYESTNKKMAQDIIKVFILF